MRVCLLTNQHLDADPFPEDDWPCDPRPFLPEADWELGVLDKETAVEQVVALTRRGFDLFFNLCDGAWDEANPGIEVVQTLERMRLPFTGSNSEFYEPTREAMKRVCRAWGIDTPAHVVAHTAEDVERAAGSLRFPLFVKHPSSYASVGLTRESRVDDPAALRRQADRMMTAYGAALIEEYIDGIECTVLVAENPDDPMRPVTYKPIQYRFPDGESFKHSDMKWVDYAALETAAVADAGLEARLRDAAARFFVGLRGSGYGRCDLRVDAEGRAFMLEINPNCGLYYPPEDAGSADFCLLNDPAGHAGFTRLIVEAAFRRHRRSLPVWEALPRPGGGYGVYATRPLAAGERILSFEGAAHRLVSRSQVEAGWSERRRQRFRRHAWPLTDELWVYPARDPEEWTPVRHGCEPTAWLSGLDVVARRPLAAGDEVTVDYATYRNELMPAFRCDCGAACCRGVIRGDDYRQQFVARYGDHLSEYVRRRRQLAGGAHSQPLASRPAASPG